MGVGMVEAKIGLDVSVRHLLRVTLGGAAGKVGVGALRDLSLKLLASSVSAEIL
jgi:hypothetical protein